MEDEAKHIALSKEEIQDAIVEILEDITSDWDLEFNAPIGPETRIISDLEFESIDVVQFIVSIEERFKRRGLPFEELIMVDGRYVEEIRVGDTIDFLYSHLNA